MKKAAEAGLALSCSNLSAKYETGSGTAKDYQQAVRWAEEAVRLEPHNAQYRNQLERLRPSKEQVLRNLIGEPEAKLVTGADPALVELDRQDSIGMENVCLASGKREYAELSG